MVITRGPIEIALHAAIALTAGAAAACAGPGSARPSLDAVEAGTTATGVSPPQPLGVSLFGQPCVTGPVAVGWSPLRRISRVEYNNMVRDLLGDTTRPANAFPPESPLSDGVNFQANTYEGASAVVVQDYLQAAEALAQTATSDANILHEVLPCQTEDDACAKQFITTWANTAFRGQLDPDASAGLFQLYADTKATFDFVTGIQAVVTAVLESPRFLYVLEFGGSTNGGQAVPLTSYEVAARLALYLWRSVPDAALMTAASNDQLSTADQVRAQAGRMLADSKARDAIDDFTTQWMQLQSTATLGKDTQFASWNGRGAELVDETLTDVSQTVLGGGGLTDLLTSPASYINADLAQFYSSGPGNGPTSLGTGARVTVADSALGDKSFAQTLLPNRAGILTNAGVLATQAHTTLPSSVLRGKLVREQVLCDTIPRPPPGIPPPAASVGDAGTTRALLSAHFDKPGCSGCHQYMDPIGLGFGFFDATGAYQPNDANGYGAHDAPPGGFPAIDASGRIAAMTPGGLATSFDGAIDLVTKLAAAPQTRQCFALQQLRYALSRIETRDDACSAEEAYDAFSTNGFSIQKLMLALVGSDAFRHRSRVSAGSSCQ